MKHSIKKIFQNLNTYLSFIMIVSFIAALLIAEQNISFQKVDILNKEKRIINSLTKLNQYDFAIALLQLNSKSTQLQREIDKLKSLYKYDYTDQYIFHHGAEYLIDLKTLHHLTIKFSNSARNFYTNKDKSKEPLYKKDLDINLHNTNNQINMILLKGILHNQEKFKLIEKIAFAVLLVSLMVSFWYRKRLYFIYKDLEFLSHTDKNKLSYNIYSMEADAIAMRMNRKSILTNNPSMIDPITEINNYKGMMTSYAEKKNMKDSNFTSVAILEIDNFSKTKRTFSQEVTQAMLKKIAYTMSLHEQAADVIARTDYNQFTLILSRPSKEQAFKDIDLIRESIAELKFNSPDKGALLITVSGGFIIKPNNTNLEEAMRQAKEILAYAKEIGMNKILQIRDMSEKEI